MRRPSFLPISAWQSCRSAAVLLTLLLMLCVTSAWAQQPDDSLLPTLFAHPPKGYGEVPFYWWNGDTLTRERLQAQLDILAEAPIEGFSVSYIHTDPAVDTLLNAGGHGSYGRADGGSPEVFSEAWWDTWRWFAEQCADRGISVGLDDYVVARPGNGYFIDDILSQPSFRQYKGRLIKQDGKIVAVPSPELHPDYGREIVSRYFQEFENRLSEKGRKAMNYFFQDELTYNLDLHSWCEDMPEQFLQRKGYDVLPYLEALFTDIGDITPKIRMDYAEVLTQLAEERYFRPIFEWHDSRGLLYGCDNEGRGNNPTQYLDYFRAHSWFTAPGNDAPSRGSSFFQTKVSSSVAHLYQRSRTWLEAFHSMGWDSNGDWLTSQLDHHYLAGGNLLCLHGLYYSTHGGWWEWAPPCFHYRMPYWKQMIQWLQYAERLSFLLSQGSHKCDIAVLYPTENKQVGDACDMRGLRELVDDLSLHGLDCDLIDYNSLRKASVKDGRLHVADEAYRVVILCGIKDMQYTSLAKIADFIGNGGLVYTTQGMPESTSLRGRNDAETLAYIEQVLRPTYIADRHDVVKKLLSGDQAFLPDFSPGQGRARVLHRKAGQYDIYMVGDMQDTDVIFFRQLGKVELWNATDGSVVPLGVLRQTEQGTWLRLPKDGRSSYLVVFSPGEAALMAAEESECVVDSLPLDTHWTVSYVPTMDNRWGDYRLPESNEMIGVEGRDFDYTFVSSAKQLRKVGNELAMENEVYGYGAFMQLALADTLRSIDEVLSGDIDTLCWQPYHFSWQLGVKDSPGSQGCHGLKRRVDDRFLLLDKGAHQLFRTRVYAPETGEYRILTEGCRPDRLLIDGQTVSTDHLRLRRGWHSLLLVYANTPKTDYALDRMRVFFHDNRQRSAVVIVSESDADKCLAMSKKEGEVSMKWAKMAHLPYAVNGGEKGFWCYQMTTAPGTERLLFDTAVPIHRVWIDGQAAQMDGQTLHIPTHDPVKVTFTTQHNDKANAAGAALFRQPVKMACGEGVLQAGDWTLAPGLRYYSGCVVYRQTIDGNKLLQSGNAGGGSVTLDLGEVDSTCEIFVDGTLAATLIGHPFKADLTPYLHEGDVQLEVKVYSSLANHYQTIPTPYRGTPHAGLIGPVNLLVSHR